MASTYFSARARISPSCSRTRSTWFGKAERALTSRWPDFQGKAPTAGEIERKKGQGHDLAREGFGGGHTDLGSGMEVDAEVRLSSDGGANRVHDPHGGGASALGLPEGRQRIGGLTGLADGHHQGGFIHQGALVPELRGVFHLHGNPGQVLQHVFTQEARVPGGPAGRDDDPLDSQEFQVRDGHAPQLGHALVRQGAGPGGHLEGRTAARRSP